MVGPKTEMREMKKKGELMIDHKRRLVYRVKDVKGAMVVIERVLPSSHILTNLDFLEPCFDENRPCLISLCEAKL